MLLLLGVLAKGGVPVLLRTFTEIESATVIGPILEVLKGLSKELQLGQVSRLEFQKNRLLVTEARKGYTVIALVDKAEEFLEVLIRIISEDIDRSSLPDASESVSEEITEQVDQILNQLIQEEVDINISKVVKQVWHPVLETIIREGKLTQSFAEIDQLVQEAKGPSTKWEDFTSKSRGNLEDAVELALVGKFDEACAICMRLEDPLAQLFAMKLGLLALSTTSTIAPPLYKLRRIGETLPLKYRPFAELAYASTLYMGQLMSSQEYAKVYQSTAAKFKFGDELQDLIFAFLFIDLKVVTLPDFAIRLIEYFQDKSPILSSYVQAIVERNELFTKLYSVASYSEFKDQVSIWKNKIASTLDDVNQFLQPGFLNKLLKRRPEAGVTGSLNLGTYIALYTALAESPVLSLSERKEVLEEVWHVYTQYFRKLLQSDLQLFSYTIDSIFQSVSVVLGEIFTLLPLKKRSAHIQKMKEFLQDVFSAITEEWIREHEDVSTIFVITNAIFPKLYTADVLPDEAIRLAYLAMRLQDVKVLEKQQKRDPLGFVTDVGNLNGALATLALKLLKGEQKKQILSECVRILVNVHKFFLLHGIVCRDDVFTLTHLTSEIIDEVDSKTVNEFLNPIIALNQIAITDFEKNESDVAMMARPLIELLMKAWKRLGDDVYRQTAYQVYQIASKAWQKYGFNGKADEFEQLYGKILNSS